MRKTFDAELRELGGELTAMASQAQEALDMVTASLTTGDRGKAHQAIELTGSMDELERDVENRCMHLLLRQQPVARDLRTISTALKMVTDLQRIGGQAANIAEISLLLAEQDCRADIPEGIQMMSRRAGQMVKQAIGAYAERDEGAALGVIGLDDEVDGLFLRVKAELTERIVEKGSGCDHAVDLIMIAKYLERVADHGVNIAKWAIFCVTGRLR